MVSTLERRAFLLASGGIGIANGVDATGVSQADTERAESSDERSNEVAVVSQHSLATDAGLEILEAGGSAADAAVAVACALSVVEPWFSSALGGGTWALYYDADSGEVTSLDGVGPIGSEASVEDYEARADEAGMHQSIVPGAWDGWMLWLREYGELDLETVLEPAITLAREGYPASPGMASWLETESEELEVRPDAQAIYAPDGDLLEEGDTVYQHDMADTFEALADAYEERSEEGREEAIQAARDHFYRGPIAEAIVDFSDERDGYLTLEDFHEFEAEIVDPIAIDWNEDVRVYQNPPNSQGITQLLALNVLKGFDLEQYDPDDPDAIHLQAEALKLAFADRHYHVGDPDRVDVPVDDLLDDEYAAAQRDRIETDEAMAWPIDSGLEGESAAHTTTFHVVDAAGNAAAVTTSLGAQFQVVGDTGIHINNRMRMVALEEDDPNRLTPGSKVRHTSNPYMATREGEPYVLGGNTGVDTQPQGQTQQFVNVVAFGLDAQAAIDSPRFETTAFPSTQYPYEVENALEMEREFPDEVVADLEERGHDVDLGRSFGTANAIVVDEDGSLDVGSESRIETAEGIVSQLLDD
ncbi:gamma-glutamyltransferase family protein [Halopiger goleimassiliensis]|uniref:gamma-glutamyltransferase family protein n=1 Tax=Halopiger goleimassiliensis TaxID=1293048 RepID=UPI0006775D5A|nr:gamma-glutamyltransferase [Halopiger goleimassiliensis]